MHSTPLQSQATYRLQTRCVLPMTLKSGSMTAPSVDQSTGGVMCCRRKLYQHQRHSIDRRPPCYSNMTWCNSNEIKSFDQPQLPQEVSPFCPFWLSWLVRGEAWRVCLQT